MYLPMYPAQIQQKSYSNGTIIIQNSPAFLIHNIDLKTDLAGVISSVFYDGRLKSGKAEKETAQSSSSVALVDSSKIWPFH